MHQKHVYELSEYFMLALKLLFCLLCFYVTTVRCVFLYLLLLPEVFGATGPAVLCN